MKFKIKANSILQKVKKNFETFQKPSRIVSEYNYEDKEKKQIEKQFINKDRDNLSPYDASMMIIDGALIEPKAFFYFLPRLVDAVINENADFVILKSRLENIDRSFLNQLQIDTINDLEKLLIQIDEELN